MLVVVCPSFGWRMNSVFPTDESASCIFLVPIGQTPNSPKLCQFPSLPDMSPKKVSAAHNVYVSPLRPTKVSLFGHVYTMQ